MYKCIISVEPHYKIENYYFLNHKKYLWCDPLIRFPRDRIEDV